MRQCQKCIISDSFPTVTIENGLCSFCRQHETGAAKNREVKGHDQLAALFAPKKTAAYHCAVPLSGGKDSSYILYYAVRKLGLKPLAMHFDNGFVTPMAKGNVERICTTLGVDLVVGKASRYRQKMLQEALLMSRDLGRFVKYCGNCENNLRSFAINEASRRNIPYLLWGATDFEDSAKSFQAASSSMKFREQWGTAKYKLGKARQHTGTLVGAHVPWSRKLRAVGHAAMYMFYCVCDNLAIGAPEGWRKLSPFLEVTFARKPVQAVYFYDYIQYDPSGHVETLRRELQWESPDDQQSRFDCRIVALKELQQLRTTGLTASGFTMASLVRTGRLDREEALKKEQEVRRRLVDVCREVAEQVGVDINEMLAVPEA